MWMEESIGRRSTTCGPGAALETGATWRVACPFCYIMMDDGVKAAGKDDDEVKVGDIAMHVLEAIEAADAGPEPHRHHRTRSSAPSRRGTLPMAIRHEEQDTVEPVEIGPSSVLVVHDDPRAASCWFASWPRAADRCDGPTTSTRCPTRCRTARPASCSTCPPAASAATSSCSTPFATTSIRLSPTLGSC